MERTKIKKGIGDLPNNCPICRCPDYSNTDEIWEAGFLILEYTCNKCDARFTVLWEPVNWRMEKE